MKLEPIPDSVLFFFEQSNEPWGVKDKESRYVYANKAYLDFLDIPVKSMEELIMKSYDFVPSLRPLIDGLELHDQEVMLTGLRHEAVGTIFVKDNYRTFLFEKWPRFSSDGNITGTIFHLKPFEELTMNYFIDKPFYGEVTYSPPTKIFSPREWDVLFLLFRRMDKKQISIVLHIKETSVRNLVSRLYLRTGATKKEELLNYGVSKGWHLYIPPRFSEISYEILSK